MKSWVSAWSVWSRYMTPRRTRPPGHKKTNHKQTIFQRRPDAIQVPTKRQMQCLFVHLVAPSNIIQILFELMFNSCSAPCCFIIEGTTFCMRRLYSSCPLVTRSTLGSRDHLSCPAKMMLDRLSHATLDTLSST